jgi:bisphosphoglycerate-dependent phosphoglycerate mutase
MIIADYFTSILLLVITYLWILNTRDDELIVAKAILRKATNFFDAIMFMIFSKDSKGVGQKKNPDPDRAKGKPSQVKTIIFLRHGESDWNNIFNKGVNLGMVKRFFLGLKQEFMLYPSLNSVFLDSPLNEEGIEQAVELRKFIQAKESGLGQPEKISKLLKILNNEPGAKNSSMIVSSTLRRAIATTTLALWPRIEKNQEKIHLLSCLQEISRNVDTFQLSPSQAIADLPFERLYSHCGGKEKLVVDNVFDTSSNYGNKSFTFNGGKRLLAFNDWAFQQQDISTIIVGGHSLWFKNFFQTFLPHQFEHDAKNKKITNSGMVAFELHAHDMGDGSTQYRIDPESIVVLYGGFTSK